MTRSLSRRTIVTLLTLALATQVSWTSDTRAADAPASLSDSLTGEAKDAYEAGKRIYGLGDFAGAGVKFKHAYALSKDVRLLWNWAACERAQLHYAKAYNILEQYTREGANTLSADELNGAAETKAALREFYSLLKLTIDPAGAKVRVDGAELGVAPLTSPYALDLGPHTLRVEAPGYVAAEQKLEVPGKTDLSLTITLKREKAAPSKLSIHAGASDAISVDGKTLGVGHYDGTVTPGAHVVRVTAAGMKPYEARVEVTAGGTRTMDVALVREPAEAGVPTWLWVTGSVVAAGGLAVGGYYLFRPKDEPGSQPAGIMGTAKLPLRIGGF